ncbi:YitT family protein [Gorillibacterium timonense]|uniref:YitT family protein n=1 Tax=Gorillibacterium timonense TaxID=1689269 RepID=UPI00071CC632|nr:YitT family protein [Gorillibacterium timonense]
MKADARTFAKESHWVYIREVLIVLLSSLLLAAGLELFLIPHQLLSGGVAGLASIIGYLTNWNISALYFVLNIPLVVWGWRAVGRRYIILSLVSILSTTWFMELIPAYSLTKYPLLGAVFGGIVTAVGIGFSLRAGGSTGGFDIIGSVVTRRRDFPMGTVMLLLNGVVILILGFYKNWDLALFSMLSTYVKGKFVDLIHVRHIKMTCFIITKKKDHMLNCLRKLPHGITCMETVGGYSEESNYMFMTVTTRYEVAELKRQVLSIDPAAFINMVESTAIVGRFVRPKKEGDL